MKKLLVRVARRAILGKQAEDPDREPSRAQRVINRVAGIVFPTNKSGNNMSVR